MLLMIVIRCLLLGASVTNLRQISFHPPTTPYGVPPGFIILRERQSPQKNPAYINILNNLEKQ